MPKLNFSREEYAERLQKTRQAMQNSGLDLIIVSDPSNMAWLTGYHGWSFYVHQCAMVSLTDEPVWFGRSMDANGAALTCYMKARNIIGYPDHYVQSTERHPMDYLCGQLADRKLDKGIVGVEMDNYWFSAAAFNSLKKGFPNARFEDATGLVNWQRAVKSPAEIAMMEKAARIVERMHARIRETARVGMRKCDLAAEIYDASLRYEDGHGGDFPAIVPMMPSGGEAAAPHLTWTDEPLKPDEGVFFEIAGCYNRYHCPLSRTLYFGKPPHHFLDAEKAVLEGMDAGLEMARAGNRCEDIAKAFFGVLKRHGVEKDSRTGYSIGLSYPPDWGERTMSLRSGDQTELQENMCFHFMPGIWTEASDGREGWGLEITESIVIGKDGPRCLADVPRNLLVKD